MRRPAMGRKNWTFAGSDEGGERAAIIYTLIETAKRQPVPRRPLEPRRQAAQSSGHQKTKSARFGQSRPRAFLSQISQARNRRERQRAHRTKVPHLPHAQQPHVWLDTQLTLPVTGRTCEILGRSWVTIVTTDVPGRRGRSCPMLLKTRPLPARPSARSQVGLQYANGGIVTVDQFLEVVVRVLGTNRRPNPEQRAGHVDQNTPFAGCAISLDTAAESRYF